MPFIVRWPGHVPAGCVDNHSILFGTDWLTAVASIANTGYDPNLYEGEDMSDVWLGAARSRQNPLFFRQLNNFSRKFMRYGRWKLHVHLKELYDLETGEFELKNLYNERPNIVAQMLDSYNVTLPTIQQRLPGPASPFDPSAPAPKICIPDIDDAFPPSPPPPPPSLSPPPPPSPKSQPPTVSQQSLHKALSFRIAGILCLANCLHPVFASF